jgi:hypothetical protein
VIGAARLGGSDVGSSQAKPGRSDGFRYPVALICCRGHASVVRGQPSATGETRRAWSGQDKDPAAVGHSAKRPGSSRVNAQNPGHDGGAKLRSSQEDIRNNDRALLRRCSLFDIPEGHPRPVHRCALAPPPPASPVPLPRVAGEDPLGHDLSLILPRLAGEGDQPKAGGGGTRPLNRGKAPAERYPPRQDSREHPRCPGSPRLALLKFAAKRSDSSFGRAFHPC